MGQRVRENAVLFGILLLGAGLRLLGLTNPLLDDQGWRQADTASMAWNMLGHLTEFPEVFYPKLNYDGWQPQPVELEFPFLPYLLALTWDVLGRGDIWGRLWAIGFSLTTLVGVFVFGRGGFSFRVGVVSALFYAALPLAVYYGRVVMPEPVSQAFGIWALVAILYWRKFPTDKKLVLSAILMAMTVLAKLPQLMLLPVGLCIGFWPWQNNGKSLLLYSGMALAPPLFYYLWVHGGAGESQQFVSGILAGQIIGGEQLYGKELIKNLRQGVGLPALLLAGAGLGALAWALLNSGQIKGWPTGLNQPEHKSVAIALILWCGISLFYTGIICLRIPLDYYLVPILIPVALCAAIALRIPHGIPSAVGTCLVVVLMLQNFAEDYPHKYAWKEEYLTQAIWLKQHTENSSRIVLSAPPPMTLYYGERFGKRLIEEGDNQALGQLRKMEGDYLVALPGSRSEAFWLQIKSSYAEVGPGIYRLRESPGGM